MPIGWPPNSHASIMRRPRFLNQRAYTLSFGNDEWDVVIGVRSSLTEETTVPSSLSGFQPGRLLV